MRGLSAHAFFCEDIRREVGGRETVIGIMPDTVQVPRFPWTMRRLAVHFRIKLSVDFICEKPILVDVESPEADIEPKERGPAPKDLIERTIERAKERGLPYGTILGRVELTEPLEFTGPTTLFTVLKYGDEREICGVLNLIERPKEASTVTELSLPAAPSK
jgi:hypothetical protein